MGVKTGPLRNARNSGDEEEEEGERVRRPTHMVERGRRETSRRGPCLAVCAFSALVTAAIMSAGFSLYLNQRKQGRGGDGGSEANRAQLKAATDRNALLQGELLKLNASVTDVVVGLDAVSRTVIAAKSTLPQAEPRRGGRSSGSAANSWAQDLERLEKELEALRAENKALTERPAPVPAASVRTLPGASAPARWLTLGIPTVPRKHEERYLEQTVEAITQQLPLRQDDPLFDRVMVVVLNNKPGQHAIFAEVKAWIEGGPYARYFKFVEEAIQQNDNYKNPEHDDNVPSTKVRRQTRAAIAMLRASAGLANYFMFMEDDFVLCPHALYALQYIISKAHAYKTVGFSGIRVSYGLCGVVLNDGDVVEFADYLEQHQARRPPDHLVSEWINAETQQAQAYLKGRNNFGYRFNILEHVGVVSSLRESRQTGWPGCYQELVYPIVFEGEAWNPKQCPADDLWPCDSKPKEYPADWVGRVCTRICRAHECMRD